MNTINRSQQRLLALMGILLLIGLFLAVKHFSASTSTTLPDKFIQTVNDRDLQVIEINNGQTILVLQKKDGIWYQTGPGILFPGDQTKIASLLQNIYSLKKDTLVSTNKAKQKDLGLNGQNIALKSKTSTETINLGSITDSDKIYVRHNSDNEVYLVPNITDLFAPFDFRDLNTNILNNADNVTDVKITYDGNQLEAQKKGKIWFVNGKQAKTQQIDFFLNDLKTLKAEDLLKSLPQEIEQDPALEITVKEKDDERVATFYKRNDIRYLLKPSYSPFVYEVSSAYVESFKKTEKDFVE